MLQQLGIQDALAAAGRATGLSWAALLGVTACAAAVTLVVGAALYHFRLRHHTQQQVRAIMCAALVVESAAG